MTPEEIKIVAEHFGLSEEEIVQDEQVFKNSIFYQGLKLNEAFKNFGEELTRSVNKDARKFKKYLKPTLAKFWRLKNKAKQSQSPL